MSNASTTDLAANYGRTVCQFCRRRWATPLAASCCATSHPRGTRTQRFLACSGCNERVFVGHRCESCGALRADPEERTP